jgi:hypothetical protein
MTAERWQHTKKKKTKLRGFSPQASYTDAPCWLVSNGAYVQRR